MIRFILFTTICVLQFIAIVNGLQCWFDINWILATLFAFIIIPMPIIGTLIGMYAAINVWDWTWFQAVFLFWGPFIILVFITIILQSSTKIYTL